MLDYSYYSYYSYYTYYTYYPYYKIDTNLNTNDLVLYYQQFLIFVSFVSSDILHLRCQMSVFRPMRYL